MVVVVVIIVVVVIVGIAVGVGVGPWMAARDLRHHLARLQRQQE